VTVTDMGRRPTEIVPVPRSVAADSTSTESEFMSATYSADPLGVTATACGSAPALVTPVIAPLAASIFSSVPASGFVT
jgi:hypothetical protein